MTLIALGADHAGFPLKEALKDWLTAEGHGVLDLGTHSPDSVDYPDYAARVAESIRTGRAERGVLICGTGIGMAMAANKVDGIRAAVCGDPETARLSREHNDANVLALGGRTIEGARAVDILRVWLATPFLGGRHARRLQKLVAIERGNLPDGESEEKESPHASAR